MGNRLHALKFPYLSDGGGSREKEAESPKRRTQSGAGIGSVRSLLPNHRVGKRGLTLSRFQVS